MKHHNTSSLGLFVLAGISLSTQGYAIVTMDYVSVGNAGNAADTTGYGAVGYTYNIGKNEVTNAQYAEFLNAKGASNSNGIYNANMAGYGITQNGTSGSFTYSVTVALADKPVVYVSWYDAARFANWLLNGQGSGDMETGAYTLTGNTGIIAMNPGAQIHLPSEDEWYKAAYYNGDAANYSLYPTGQNTINTADANYNNSVGTFTNVGSYVGDPSFYGTFDQGGNAWEWNDAVISVSSSRGLRGGSWGSASFDLRTSNRGEYVPSGEADDVGFRVVSVPEPTSLVLTMLAGSLMLTRRKR